MKANELEAMIKAVKTNVSNFKDTRGENTLEGLEHFTAEMLDAFDTWYDREIAKLLS